jgi:hypothetical protein
MKTKKEKFNDFLIGINITKENTDAISKISPNNLSITDLLKIIVHNQIVMAKRLKITKKK